SNDNRQRGFGDTTFFRPHNLRLKPALQNGSLPKPKRLQQTQEHAVRDQKTMVVRSLSQKIITWLQPQPFRLHFHRARPFAYRNHRNSGTSMNLVKSSYPNATETFHPMNSSNRASEGKDGLEALEQRLGQLYITQRLGIEDDHEADRRDRSLFDLDSQYS